MGKVMPVALGEGGGGKLQSQSECDSMFGHCKMGVHYTVVVSDSGNRT